MNREILRDYQQEMLERLRVAWKTWRSVMVQMPTGTGKTHLMAAVISEQAEGIGDEHGGVLIVAHRRELIEQIRATIKAFGIESDKVVVESIQRLSRRGAGHVGDSRGAAHYSLLDCRFSLIIVDEAHHAVAKTYRQLWEWWPEAKFLGLTATPCRLNQTGFTDLFDTLLEAWPIQKFIDKGWLSDFEYVSVTPDNWMVERIAGLKKRGVDGDYQMKEMATVMDTQESVEHLYRSYKQFVNGKKGIVYAISCEHAKHIAAYYQSQGVRCAVIDAKTPAEERKAIVRAYKESGEIDVIVNVDIFSEGFDSPEVEFIQLARPTLSLSKYLQQVGRGMRRTPGKDYVVILDQVGMYQTFGIPSENRRWDLMFRGREKGLARQGGEHGYVIREEDSDLTLLNLQMVRIKRRGEKHLGVEIFMKGGRYGILNDGRVTCAPEFAHIQRIKAGSFFALATYPYAVFKGKTTIISLAGMDLRASLYGKVKAHGEVFEGETIGGQQTFWDSVGQQYYNRPPEFEVIGGVEMVNNNGRYQLRRKSIYQREPVGKEDIWFNRYILWMKNVVVHKETGNIYPIKAYGTDCFYVDSDDPLRGRLIRIGFDGSKTYANMMNMSMDLYRVPVWGQTKMVRASSGKMEVMSSVNL